VSPLAPIITTGCRRWARAFKALRWTGVSCDMP
jgi:hypothetical protein